MSFNPNEDQSGKLQSEKLQDDGLEKMEKCLELAKSINAKRKIIADDDQQKAEKICEWLGPDVVKTTSVGGEICAQCDGMLLPVKFWLASDTGTVVMERKLLNDGFQVFKEKMNGVIQVEIDRDGTKGLGPCCVIGTTGPDVNTALQSAILELILRGK